ncbi:MAG TPA: DUF1549 and DUF1553 domain-containing protein, partial [Gemmataceae bacterium]|nr:DUF1549 and DUF1553 domain-containing protein [Gemmataceae bacterium]
RALADYFGPLLPKKLNDCRTCHLPDPPGATADQLASEKPHNPFGARLKAIKSELRKAGKRIDIPTRLEAIFNEDSDGDGVSNLVELLTGHFPGDPNDKPTPKELAETPKLVAAFRKAQQAYHWTPFETVKRPAVPAVRNTSWVRNPIDAFIAAGHEEHGLQPRPEAAKSTLLRRLYLDLIGLPPTRAELHAFLGDQAPDAYEQVLDRLLASPRYGERWGRHWMDVWRYSDWAGFGEEVREGQKHIWHWRDWIIESLNKDKGYDRMVQEMLAADELAPEDGDALRATGFLVRNWYKFNRQVWLDHTVEHTSKAFLALTLNCARCHDHMYDPITQQEHYAFRALFEPHDVRTDRLPGQPDINKGGLPRVYDRELTAPTYLFVRGNELHPDKSRAIAPAVPALFGAEIAIHPEKLPPVAYQPDKREFVIEEIIRAGEARIERAKAALRAVDQGPARLRASSPVDADLERRFAQADLAAAEAAQAELLAILIVEHLEGAGVKDSDPGAWQDAAITAHAAQKKRALLEARRDHVNAQRDLARAEAAKATKAASQRPGRPLLTSVVKAKAQLAAAAGSLAAAEQEIRKPPTTNYTRRKLISYPSTSSGRRLALARWITDRKNPLSARVAMNHIWLRHFGKGLVPSVFDFGRNGQPASHPALLDWLADEFMRSGWSMKSMHRLIVLSSAYRMESTPHAADLAVDPDNRFMWRMNPHRVEAESVRDSVLYVAGQLDTTMSGPDIDQSLGLTVPRRSLYFRHAAEKEVEFLQLFDAANVTECYQRSESIVPQQALALSNSTLVVSQARRLARALFKEVGEKCDEAAMSRFVRIAFEQVLSRPPSAQEQAECCRFLQAQAKLLADRKKLTPFVAGAAAALAPAGEVNLRAREDLIQVLLNHNDFVTIR